MASHSQTVQAQFDPQAKAYLTSLVHAKGPDLARAVQLVAAVIPPEKGTLLDLGCGAGHLSYTMAPHFAHVLAADPSPQMLAIISETAKERGITTIDTEKADAGNLPFEEAQFCVVASRYSAHHWAGLDNALRGMRRVVKKGGYLLMIDVLGYEDDLVDTHLQAMELLRDKSHLRNLKASQWRKLIADSGFELLTEEVFPLPIEFSSWVQRMSTSVQRTEMIRTLVAEAPAEVKSALSIQPDGSFTMQTGLFWAKAI